MRDGPGTDWSDLKICEAVTLAPDKLLLLERVSKTAKIYIVHLSPEFEAPATCLRVETRPSLEHMDEASLEEAGVRLLEKTLVFSTADALQIGPDLEGMALLSPFELILVNDIDLPSKKWTRFTRSFARPRQVRYSRGWSGAGADCRSLR